jgi:4,5-DOPA dioxygenase extradiol
MTSFSPSHRRRRRVLQGLGVGGALAAVGALAGVAGAQSAPARRMPVLFIGHGSPMNLVRDNPFTQFLHALGNSLPKPAAILSVSAHWLTPGATAVGIHDRPETIHDFGGFPPALQQFDYPARGAPALALQTAGLVRRGAGVPTREWGLDHGTWTVLHHLFPAADVPVFQLSIDYAQPAAFHHAIGRDLAALRERGVLVMGSGNVVHNLRATDRMAPDGAPSRPWAAALDSAIQKALAGRDDAALLAYERLDGASTGIATPDHYYPLLYALGAAAPGEEAKSVFTGFQGGTLSMRCVRFG